MNDIVTLIPVEEGIERGNIYRMPRREYARQIYAKISSIGEREFYDSAQAGYDLSFKVEAWIWDYNGERMLEREGEEYRVVRIYSNDKRRTVELYCEKAKGRG